MSLITTIVGVKLATSIQGVRSTVLSLDNPIRVALIGGGLRGPRGFPGDPGPQGAMPTGNLSDVVYDGSDRVVSYTLDGIPFTVAYPDAFTIVRTGNGKTRTANLDLLGRITGIHTVP